MSLFADDVAFYMELLMLGFPSVGLLEDFFALHDGMRTFIWQILGHEGFCGASVETAESLCRTSNVDVTFA